MLLFHGTTPEGLRRAAREGLSGGVRLWTRLEDAVSACGEPILVVDASRLPAPPAGTGADLLRVASVPPRALLNADPYLPPRAVTAAGGYVMRPGPTGPELLLIFRRGVWDLPKGKVDAGETIEEAALREVREEVGLRALTLRASLGTTLHGYAERDKYRVKTTHWFLMQTPDDLVTPQAEEDITAVEWVPWPEARRRVGFETLQAHMAAVEPGLRAHPWLGLAGAP